MTDIHGDLPAADEADAVEQSQPANGDIAEETGERSSADAAADALAPDHWDADEADLIEQAEAIEPDREEDYASPDEV